MSPRAANKHVSIMKLKTDNKQTGKSDIMVSCDSIPKKEF